MASEATAKTQEKEEREELVDILWLGAPSVDTGEGLEGIRGEDVELFNQVSGEIREIENPDARIDYLFEKVADLLSERDQNEDARAARLAMIEDFFDGEKHRLERQAEWFLDALRQHARMYEYPKGKKSKKFPYGQIGYRTAATKIECEDEEKLIPVAEKIDEAFVDRTPKLKWGDFKRHLLANVSIGPGDEEGELVLVDAGTGEEIDLEAWGLKVVPGGEKTFFAKPL